MFKLENNHAIEFFVQKGMQQGGEKKAFESALEMFKDGLDIETIAKYLKMPVEWVENALKKPTQ